MLFLFVTVLLSVTSSVGCCYIFVDVGFSGLFITAAVEAMLEEQRKNRFSWKIQHETVTFYLLY